MNQLFGQHFQYQVLCKYNKNQSLSFIRLRYYVSLITTWFKKLVTFNKYHEKKSYKIKWYEKDVEEFAELVKSQSERGNHDGLIFILSCHGTSRNGKICIMLSDGKLFELKRLSSYFDGNSCPYLLDKPKIFVADCCLGDKRATPIASQGQHFHNESNFYFIFPNPQGYTTVNPSNGGQLLKNVQKVFSSENIEENELESISKQIRKETKKSTITVCPTFEEFENIQMVETRSTMEHDLHFKKRST